MVVKTTGPCKTVSYHLNRILGQVAEARLPILRILILIMAMMPNLANRISLCRCELGYALRTTEPVPVITLPHFPPARPAQSCARGRVVR
jgi:hypothetical protein